MPDLWHDKISLPSGHFYKNFAKVTACFTLFSRHFCL
ncbi:hypothetical protein HD_0877 [[Haemophilus] ducreyi 35000HP]|uniref:Uncharacterized protein n=1 Tax=Haemophilus ducreyi (strain 35000HP / ATCC 700724) TaxID=233412 RepID=Q7VMU0_HAEDU|nr:hypothetical protein HD_0877 [[Haemophilus] ducreyi 35000HP]